MGYIINIYSYRYSWRLERESFHESRAGYLFFLLFGMTSFNVNFGFIMNNFLGDRIFYIVSSNVRSIANYDSLFMGTKKLCSLISFIWNICIKSSILMLVIIFYLTLNKSLIAYLYF